MPTFQSNRYQATSATAQKHYRALVNRHPFLFFGLPFIGLMLTGSFFLTPATAIRYERYDRKVQTASTEEALAVGRHKRKVDPKEEYYRLAAKDIDNWEQRRVTRLPGEPDGIL